jgi:hypothetical protein
MASVLPTEVARTAEAEEATKEITRAADVQYDRVCYPQKRRAQLRPRWGDLDGNRFLSISSGQERGRGKKSHTNKARLSKKSCMRKKLPEEEEITCDNNQFMGG